MAVRTVAAAAVLAAPPARAFHSGGVGHCSGCHRMHDPSSEDHLLVSSDSSSTCLTCHEQGGDTGPSGYHVSTADADLAPAAAPRQRTPGGDFAWLKRSYADSGTGYAEPGDRHGHNIVAVDYRYTADQHNTVAPGGSVPAATLGCISCHDPHSSIRRFDPNGRYARTGLPIAASGSYADSPAPVTRSTAVGVYRLLRGGGDGASSDVSVPGAVFSTIFAAVAPSSYNRSEATSETRVAYGMNSGAWCATCHPAMRSNASEHHPVDNPLGGLRVTYGRYVSSGVLTGTDASFTSLVPFNENTSRISDLASHARSDGSFLTGPGGGDQVTCMTCHRAHASGFSKMTRWQLESEFLTRADSNGNPFYCATDSVETSGSCALGRTTVEVQAAYYDRPATRLGAWQRSLCNKCHAKD